MHWKSWKSNEICAESSQKDSRPLLELDCLHDRLIMGNGLCDVSDAECDRDWIESNVREIPHQDGIELMSRNLIWFIGRIVDLLS